jgi:hypothetical protein
MTDDTKISLPVPLSMDSQEAVETIGKMYITQIKLQQNLNILMQLNAELQTQLTNAKNGEAINGNKPVQTSK